MVMPFAEFIPYSVSANAQNLGVFLRKPCGSCAARRCQYHSAARRIYIVHRFIEKAEIKYALLRLKATPCKNAHRHLVEARKLHKPHILFKYIGSVLPLVGVVIRTVNHMRVIPQNNIFHHSSPDFSEIEAEILPTTSVSVNLTA